MLELKYFSKEMIIAYSYVDVEYNKLINMLKHNNIQENKNFEESIDLD